WPVRSRRRPERLAGGRAAAEFLPRRLGGPLGGGLGGPQPGEPAEHLLGGLGEADDHPGQAHGLRGAGRQVARIQADGAVAGAMAPMAVRAVVVGPHGADRPQQAERALGAVGDEARRLAAVGAAQARPLVPPFFRPLTAASIALAPILWTRSRTSNSVGPSNWPSSLQASSSARPRRSASVA